MKHIVCVSKVEVEKADAWQDVVCNVAHILATLVESKGGSSPLVAWIDDKCDLPVAGE